MKLDFLCIDIIFNWPIFLKIFLIFLYSFVFKNFFIGNSLIVFNSHSIFDKTNIVDKNVSNFHN